MRFSLISFHLHFKFQVASLCGSCLPGVGGESVSMLAENAGVVGESAPCRLVIKRPITRWIRTRLWGVCKAQWVRREQGEQCRHIGPCIGMSYIVFLFEKNQQTFAYLKDSKVLTICAELIFVLKEVIYLAEFFLEWEMFRTKVVRKIKRHTLWVLRL